MTPTCPSARRVLVEAVHARAFPAAVVEVGRRDTVLWREAFGRLTYDPDTPATTTATVFDLASLTKVVATTALAMRAVQENVLALDDPVARWLPEWRAEGREAANVAHLLLHASGLPAWRPLYESCRGPEAFRAAIARMPLEFAPGTASVYSDVGFITLGFVLEQALGTTLDAAWRRLAADLRVPEIRFGPVADGGSGIAPTEFDPWRHRLLAGEVHDENAAALGGTAAHAGLFGPARPIGLIARVWLRALAGEAGPGPFADPALAARFAARGPVAGGSRALGWDTMLPTSSCGTRLSPRAIGHTGFTGTSLWIDPDRNLYVLLLTNRVHPTRANEAIRLVRPALHDAVVTDLGAGPSVAGTS